MCEPGITVISPAMNPNSKPSHAFLVIKQLQLVLILTLVLIYSLPVFGEIGVSKSKSKLTE